jgi:hypothetical protein
VTAKPSICNAGGDAGLGAFCKSGAYAGKDSSLTTGDLPGVVRAWEGRPLGAGRPALKIEQKSAEGIVGWGHPVEGPNAARAGDVVDGCSGWQP